MILDIHLKNIKTGETGIYRHKEDRNFNEYSWDEGDWGCDCNRCLFLYGWEEEKDMKCNGGKNTIIIEKIIDVETGEFLYKDDPRDH